MHPRSLSFLVAAAGLVVLAGPLAAQRIGAFGGFNRAAIAGDAPPNVQYVGGTGFTAGLTFDLPLATDVLLSFQPSYARRITAIAFAIKGQEKPRDSLDVALTYVSVPLLVKVEAARGRSYVAGGVDVGMLLDAALTGRGPEEDLSSFVKDFDVAAVFGVGVVFPIGRPRLATELRYAQSLLNLSAAAATPSTATLPERFRMHGFQLLVGVFLPLGGE